ncbi:hypothetical protein [Nonomuraea sp. NPDC003709]|uniref:hypothetical protein n=1 Tax=Nonomuraea sp. NPDC003709 TaxID=3154450 RepID=UPI0033AE9CC3
MDIRLGVVRGLQYGLVEKPDTFAPQARELGAGLVRVFFYWSQLEPEPGRHDWSAVDAVLGQFDDDTELWFTLGAASPWGSTRSTDLLPASPPLDPAAYAATLRALVTHCRGRVRYWQCENEPCIPLFWAGTAADYVAHLATFHQAVKSADPDAAVVLGGCPPGVFSASDEPDDERDFFLQVIEEGRDAYDVFDVHLYGDPYLIPRAIEDLRAAVGDKPIVAGEYNGPLPTQYPEVFEHLAEVIEAGGMQPWHRLTVEDLHEGRLTTEPVRAAMKRLYDRMAELPPTLQMFMTGCPPELEAERHRINADDIVIRNMLALSSGLRLTVCWQLGPDMPAPPDPYNLLQLMFSKFQLMAFEGGTMSVRHPGADAFAELSSRLAGATDVRRVEVPERPDAHVFELVGTGVEVAWLRPSSPEPPTLVWNGTVLDARPQFTYAHRS